MICYEIMIVRSVLYAFCVPHGTVTYSKQIYCDKETRKLLLYFTGIIRKDNYNKNN